MSDIFAEATVKISPSLTGFKTTLEDDLKKTMAKVKVPTVRVKAGLEIGFIGKLRDQVNDAVTRVQGQVKPIRVKVLIDAPSRRALQEVVSGAPIAVPGVVGGVTAGAGAGVDPRRLAALEAQAGAGAGLGQIAVAEEKLTKVREKATSTSKKRQVQETATARSIRLVGEVQKDLTLIDFKAATRTGELAQAKAALAEANRIALVADEARAARVSRTTVDLQKQAHAERQLRLERVQEIEQRVPAAAAPRVSAADAAQTRARTRAVEALRIARQEEQRANDLAKTTGRNVRDLAKQREILTLRTTALAGAERAVKDAMNSGRQTLIDQTVRNRNRIRIQVDGSKEIVKSLADEEKAANRSARAEKRRSEQLSRGGQASLLSLAGIRGATLAASRSFLAGAAAVTIFAEAVRQFADLERNLHVFEATTSATHAEMEAVREEARLLGADLTLPSVTAEEAAGAMVELAKAGLTVTDSMNAARAVLELATAAAISNAEATRLVANVLNAFSLAGIEASNVADTLANAANAAQGSIADIGTAFQQAASAGRQVGLSFQDTATFLTILAKNGIRGSDAGTSLRTALIRLINPSKNAKERFRELGIEIHDAAGNLRPDVFLQIASATREMSPAMRDATIALIGGQDAFRAVTILGRQSIDSFIEMRAALREEGTAAELAAARTRGLHGSIDALQSILETVGTTMASHVGPGIAGFVYQLGRGITAMSESDEVANSLEQTLSAVAGGFNLVGQAIKGVSVVALPVAKVLAQFTNAIGVPTILGAFAAYKLLGGGLDRVTKLVTKSAAAWKALGAAQGAAAAADVASGFTQMGGVLTEVTTAQTRTVGTTTKLRAAITAAASSFNVYLLAASAAAAGIIFLASRESAAERATRKLKEATDELITSLEERNRISRESRDAPRAVGQAELGVLEAQEAVGRARSAAAASTAAKGTFARTKLELQLKLAIQDVTFAQNAYDDAVEHANQLRRQERQAIENAQHARDEEIAAINDLIDAEVERSKIVQRGASRGEDALARVVASQRITDALQKEIDKAREQNTIESNMFSDRLELLQKTNEAIVGLPDGAVDVVINAENIRQSAADLKKLLRDTGEEGGDALVESILLRLGILPKRLADYIDGPVRASLIAAGSDVGDKTGAGMAQALLAAFQAGLRRRAGKRAGLEIQEDLAVIGSAATGATLPVLQDQLALARADRAAAEAEIARLTAAGKTKGLAKAREARRAAIADERRLVEEIRGINAQLANDAESAANEAEKKQNEIFENILKAMGLKREAQQQRIEDAQISESLADDIRQTQILRKIAAKQIQNLKNRIEAARKQGLNVEVLTEGLNDLQEKWRDLGREIIDLQKQQRETLRDILFERFELRIQIAQARGNVAAEIRARRARLEELTKELVRIRRQFGKNSIEWLRAKAAQVEEIAAIKELEGSTKEKNNALRQLMFEFLTTQQGFAANLLGNLLPIGAIGGTVGARMDARAAGASGSQPSPPRITGFPGMGDFKGGKGGAGGGASIAAAAATAGATVVAPPTRGQASTTNVLLQQILQVLRHTNTRQQNPSTKKQAKRGGSANDFE